MGDPFKRAVKPRASWDKYFMKIAMLVAERSTCRRHHVGAVIVRNRKILTTGYNGAASGVKDCIQLGCLRDEMDIQSGKNHEVCRAIHAEQNAIIQAALHGVNTEGATIYCTHPPCILCAKMLINAGVKRYVSYGEYPDDAAMGLLNEAGLEFLKMEKPTKEIYEIQ
ncbi:cytidine deaminase [Candidatus Woesearchaeota archaeon]|nr:cytidine deaminase [Candidatus Woesearchaeota archaeon]